MSMERHDQELSLDQLGAISAGIILDDYVGVDVDPTVDKGYLGRPSWHKISSPLEHPRHNIQGKVHVQY